MEEIEILDKENLGPNIKLVEKTELLQNDQKIAAELNTYSKSIVPNLEINENPYVVNQVSNNGLDLVEKCISKCKFHPSILSKIRLRFKICFHSML